jgi:hypothetical protein
MTRLNRWLLVALVLQVGVLAAVRILSRGPAVVKPRKLFEGLDVAAVSRVRITGNDKKLVELEKRGSEWVLSSGGGYAVQGNKVSELLGKLSGLTAGEPVTTQADHQRALEVAADTFQREIRLERTGQKPLIFYLGTSAGLKDVHLRFADQNPVYLVKDISSWDAGTQASDWVATEYFKPERDKIVSLALENAEGKIELSKGTDGKWTLEGFPPEAKLKDSEVDALLGSASSVTLQEPVGQTLEPRFGLDPPAATLVVVTEEKREAEKDKKGGGAEKGEKKADKREAKVEDAPAATSVRTTHTLRIGVKEGDSYYARSEASPFVVRIGSWSAEAFLKKKLADFEEKKTDEAKDKDHGSEDPGGVGEPPPPPEP